MAALQPSHDSNDRQQEEATELQNMGGVIQYSLDDAVEHIGIGVFQVKIIAIAGLAWIADASEMMILSIISPILKCEWNLTVTEEALITVVVFLGIGIGSIAWGIVADKFGRKRALYISTFSVLVFGATSAGVPSYPWFLIMRFLTGCGLGGIPQAANIVAEIFPMSHRGRAVISLDFFWALGSLFSAVLAIAMIEASSWRYYLLACASPAFLFMLTALSLPESPRYLFTTGNHERLISDIEKMCRVNKKPSLKGTMSKAAISSKRGDFTELFTVQWRRTVVLLLVIWCISAFGYYGIVLLSTSMMQNKIDGCHPVPRASVPLINLPANITTYSAINGKNGSQPETVCHQLTKKDYIDFMWISTAEIPGIVAALILIDQVGRRKALAIQYAVGGISFLTLAICTTRTASIVFLFVARGAMTGSFQSAFVYTAEVLPTNIRAVGMGVCSMAARVGAMLTPFVAQVLIDLSFYYVVVMYFVPMLVCVLSALLLRTETQGKFLPDSSQSNQLAFSRADYPEYKSFK